MLQQQLRVAMPTVSNVRLRWTVWRHISCDCRATTEIKRTEWITYRWESKYALIAGRTLQTSDEWMTQWAELAMTSPTAYGYSVLYWRLIDNIRRSQPVEQRQKVMSVVDIKQPSSNVDLITQLLLNHAAASYNIRIDYECRSDVVSGLSRWSYTRLKSSPIKSTELNNDAFVFKRTADAAVTTHEPRCVGLDGSCDSDWQLVTVWVGDSTRNAY